MKKSIFIIVFVLFSGLSLNAQDYKTSLGLRAGPAFWSFWYYYKAFSG